METNPKSLKNTAPERPLTLEELAEELKDLTPEEKKTIRFKFPTAPFKPSIPKGQI